MITYFCIYSFLGYLMESIYISLIEKKWHSSGLLDGPYIPLYGFGSIILIILSSYIQHSFILTFIISSLLLTILEYLTSLYLEIVFHRHIWDYSHYPCNYHGRICLFYSILWGFLSLIFIYYIHPWLTSFISFNEATSFLSFIIIITILKDTYRQKKKSQHWLFLYLIAWWYSCNDLTSCVPWISASIIPSTAAIAAAMFVIYGIFILIAVFLI